MIPTTPVHGVCRSRSFLHDQKDWRNGSVCLEGGTCTGSDIPAGFEAVYEPIAGFTDYTLPSASLIYSSTSSTTFSGFDYINLDNANYLNPIPTEAGTGSN